jgi:hypothetical protein
MFGPEYGDIPLEVRLAVTPPASTPARARTMHDPRHQYNLSATISISTPTVTLWEQTILVPVVIGSRHCLTYGASAVRRQEMGIGASEAGGYVMNARGTLTVIRSMETTHQARPKIGTNETSIGKKRKEVSKHTEHALYVIADYVLRLREAGQLDGHGLSAQDADDYIYQTYVKQVLNPKVDGAELETSTPATPVTPATPKRRPKASKKPGAANAAAEAAMLRVPIPGKSGAPPASPVAPPQAAGTRGGSISTLYRLVRGVVAEAPRAKKPKKTPAGPVMERFMTRCAFDTINAHTTVTELLAVGLVYYFSISLPKPNRKIHVAADTYVPMALGIKMLGGRLISAFHALFYARDFLGPGLKADVLLDSFCKPGGMPNYRAEIEAAIASVVDEEMLPGVEVALGTSFQQYADTLRNLSAFELFVSFYSESPATVQIILARDLVRHATDYIVPLVGFVGADPFLAKARALASLFYSLYEAMETGGGSNLHAYRNKMIVTTGTTIFRFMRDRLNMLFSMQCAKMPDLAKTALAAARKSTCILSSFSTHDAPSNSEVSAQAAAKTATMAMQVETQLKSLMLTRIIAVPGSAHVAHAARMIQTDQTGSVDLLYSPEGGDVGKRKDFAQLGLASMTRDHALLSRYLLAALAASSAAASGAAKDKGIGLRREDVEGPDVRLLYVEAIPGCYVSGPFFRRMRDYFRRNGPVREASKGFSQPYGLTGDPVARTAMSRVQTFDIVFSADGGRYTIYHCGGILGHLALVVKNGGLVIDNPQYREYHVNPWGSGRIDALIDDGALAFVTPMETYFQCSSVQLFYDTPSLKDMPIGDDGKPSRDEDTIRACPDLCPWCWHLAVAPTAPRQSARLDRDGQLNPGEYRYTQQCGCGRGWHSRCRRQWDARVGAPLDSGACPVCNGNFDTVPLPPRNFREDYDYVTVDPSTVLGVASGTVPYANENYAVRASYQSNMTLQAADSQPGLDQKRGLNAKEALEAEVPLTTTEIDWQLQRDNHNGANLICANLMKPQNNEDGIYVSETAARECLRYRHIQTVVAPAPQKDKPIRHNMKWYDVTSEYMGICDSVDKSKFHAIDSNTGLPRIGSYLHPGDALYGRYAVAKDGTIIDRSEYCSVEVHGYVHQLDLRSFNFDPKSPNKIQVSSKLYVSVSLSMHYCYICGDKLCARYSQKGVVAKILPRSQMGRIVGGPFDGCVPDIITAPTLFPTRMTAGYCTELLASKVALVTCRQQDATAFRQRMGLADEFRMTKNPMLGEHEQILRDHGCEHGVMETMRLPDGSTALVLCGGVRYQMLRHHAAMKAKRAPYDPKRVGGDIFRQSSKGRQGNLRIGFQEGQGYYSMGVPYMLQSLISMGASNKKLLLCSACGHFATLPPASGLRLVCDCGGELVAVETVYSLVVLLHILATRGIDMTFFPSKLAGALGQAL